MQSKYTLGSAILYPVLHVIGSVTVLPLYGIVNVPVPVKISLADSVNEDTVEVLKLAK